jgi:hypothetical protein
MRSSLVVRASDVNTEVATVLGSDPASSDTVEFEGRQIKQCWIQYIEKIQEAFASEHRIATTKEDEEED